MARIRSIKPEFWTDEKVIELSFEARLLFIGLWNFCDEHGNTEGSSKRIKMQIFPADNLDIEKYLEEIRLIGFLSYYEVEGKKYIHINNFNKHQKVNEKTAHKFPPPEKGKLSDQSDKKALDVSSLDVSSLGKEKTLSNPPELCLDSKPPPDTAALRFETLWSIWPKNLGAKGSKSEALAKFKQIKPDDLLLTRMRRALTAQAEHKRGCVSRGEFYENFPHVVRWLSKRRWEDELSEYQLATSSQELID